MNLTMRWSWIVAGWMFKRWARSGCWFIVPCLCNKKLKLNSWWRTDSQVWIERTLKMINQWSDSLRPSFHTNRKGLTHLPKKLFCLIKGAGCRLKSLTDQTNGVTYRHYIQSIFHTLHVCCYNEQGPIKSRTPVYISDSLYISLVLDYSRF